MTKSQATLLAEWVELCSSMQDTGENLLLHLPHGVSARGLLLKSFATQIALDTKSTTSDNFADRCVIIQRHLADAIIAALNECNAPTPATAP